jgi:hypothetical protein
MVLITFPFKSPTTYFSDFPDEKIHRDFLTRGWLQRNRHRFINFTAIRWNETLTFGHGTIKIEVYIERRVHCIVSLGKTISTQENFSIIPDL